MISTGLKIPGFPDFRYNQKWWRKPKSCSRVSDRKPRDCQAGGQPYTFDFWQETQKLPGKSIFWDRLNFSKQKPEFWWTDLSVYGYLDKVRYNRLSKIWLRAGNSSRQIIIISSPASILKPVFPRWSWHCLSFRQLTSCCGGRGKTSLEWNRDFFLILRKRMTMMSR